MSSIFVQAIGHASGRHAWATATCELRDFATLAYWYTGTAVSGLPDEDLVDGEAIR